MSPPAPSPGTSPALLLREDRGPVAWLTLNRPEARNSLSRPLMGALEAALDAVAADERARVLVLAGAGPAFCAGHDLREMQALRQAEDGGAAAFRDLFAQCSRLMQRLVHLPKPVIARVHGIATAAGCQLVASCDLAVAEEGARFATPGVNIGLFCSTPMVALSRNLGRKQAMEMLLTGEAIDAETARAFGLINRVCPAAALDDTVQSLAETIAAKSALTLRIGKEAFYRQIELDLAKAYAYAGEVMARNMLALDAEEGICAFLDKRPPRWQDR